MHEMAIATEVLELVQETAALHKADRIVSVTLLIGELTGVEPESLRFCFSALADGTLAQGADLTIETVPLICRCYDCAGEFPISQYRFVCSDCHSTSVEIVSGRELCVKNIEVE